MTRGNGEGIVKEDGLHAPSERLPIRMVRTGILFRYNCKADMRQSVLLLGVEAGGTKTECAVLDETGQLLGYGRGGPANLNFVSEKTQRLSIRTAIEHAVEGVKGQVRAVGYTIAGSAGQLDWLRDWLQKPSLWHYGELHVAVAITGMIKPHGLAVIAGTGSAIGYFQHGEAIGTVGGWGSLLGDEGSAYDVAIRAIRSAVRAFDGRQAPTCLVDAVRSYFQIGENLRDLIPLFYRKSMPRHQVAGFAAEVVRVADELHDRSAVRILQESARLLAQDVIVGAKPHFAKDEAVPVSLSGGMFRAKGTYYTAFIETLQKRYPNCKIRLPRYRPATAVAHLTLRDWKRWH
jgi:N-acetylglucosamine kinase-like BadF-type ATPase